MQNHTKNLGLILAFCSVLAAFIVIGMGAFTRLADAGLGCPDWPTCYGHILWPIDNEEITVANQAYDETPVENDKTWPEQVHRLFAATLGLISLLIFAIAIKNGKDKTLNKQLVSLVSILLIALVIRITSAAQWDVGASVMTDFFDVIIGCLCLLVFASIAFLAKRRGASGTPIILPAFIVAFVIMQGLFGMWTVTLKVWPQVVTTHLLGGFTVVSLLWLLTLRLQARHWQFDQSVIEKVTGLKKLTYIATVIVFLQIALGGWTTSNYAAVACPDLPTCQNQWWPEMDFAKGFDITQAIGPNYLGGQMDNAARMAIHMSHRIGAVITTLALVLLAFKLFMIRQRTTTSMAIIILFVLAIQVILGLSNIIYQFPINVAVAHNAVGAVLLLVMVTLNYRLHACIQSKTVDKG